MNRWQGYAGNARCILFHTLGRAEGGNDGVYAAQNGWFFAHWEYFALFGELCQAVGGKIVFFL